MRPTSAQCKIIYPGVNWRVLLFQNITVQASLGRNCAYYTYRLLRLLMCAHILLRLLMCAHMPTAKYLHVHGA